MISPTSLRQPGPDRLAPTAFLARPPQLAAETKLLPARPVSREHVKGLITQLMRSGSGSAEARIAAGLPLLAPADAVEVLREFSQRFEPGARPKWMARDAARAVEAEAKRIAGAAHGTHVSWWFNEKAFFAQTNPELQPPLIRVRVSPQRVEGLRLRLAGVTSVPMVVEAAS